MYTSYRGAHIIQMDLPPQDLSLYNMLIEKYKLIELKSPLPTGHLIFFYDNKYQIWQININIGKETIKITKPESDIYDQVREFNNLPKLSIHKAVQKDQLI